MMKDAGRQYGLRFDIASSRAVSVSVSDDRKATRAELLVPSADRGKRRKQTVGVSE